MKITNKILAQALNLGFDFEQFMPTTNLTEISTKLTEFFEDNCDCLPQIEDECEVHGHGNSQTVSYGDYVCYGKIADFSENWHKPVGTKVYHSSIITIDSDGLAKCVKLYYLVGITEYNQNYTYDIVFDTDYASNSKGFAYDYSRALEYIKTYNGTNESYFENYKGGTVSIVCNETSERLYQEQVM